MPGTVFPENMSPKIRMRLVCHELHPGGQIIKAELRQSGRLFVAAVFVLGQLVIDMDDKLYHLLSDCFHRHQPRKGNRYGNQKDSDDPLQIMQSTICLWGAALLAQQTFHFPPKPT